MEPTVMYQRDIACRACEILSRRLKEKNLLDAVIVSASMRGMLVAAPLANMMNLPLEILPAHVIRHPADLIRSIGSVIGIAGTLTANI